MVYSLGRLGPRCRRPPSDERGGLGCFGLPPSLPLGARLLFPRMGLVLLLTGDRKPLRRQLCPRSIYRGVGQLVVQRIPNPPVAGSTPAASAGVRPLNVIRTGFCLRHYSRCLGTERPRSGGRARVLLVSIFMANIHGPPSFYFVDS
jgi:hypothetical protein